LVCTDIDYNQKEFDMTHDPMCVWAGKLPLTDPCDHCAYVAEVRLHERREVSFRIESLTCWNDIPTGMTVIDRDEALTAVWGES
jgi:hypothetical protein